MTDPYRKDDTAVKYRSKPSMLLALRVGWSKAIYKPSQSWESRMINSMFRVMFGGIVGGALTFVVMGVTQGLGIAWQRPASIFAGAWMGLLLLHDAAVLAHCAYKDGVKVLEGKGD